MRLKGLEPPRLSAPDPKSGAATNYATAAVRETAAKIDIIFNAAIMKLSIVSNFTKNTFLFIGILTHYHYLCASNFKNHL